MWRVSSIEPGKIMVFVSARIDFDTGFACKKRLKDSTMMIKYLLSTAALFGAVSGFHTAPVAFTRCKSTALNEMWYPKEFERAVKCAENFGLCDAEELEKLADELESYQGSFFEEEEGKREKEVMGRRDIVEILKMEKELMLRKKDLKEANLFKKDVEEAHNANERDEYLEHMEEYSDT